MDGAGAALCNAASIFGSGQSDVLADCPEKRRIVFDVDADCLAIDVEVCHRVSPYSPNPPSERGGNLDWKGSPIQIKKLRLQPGR
jgi:hypothetical protein